MTRPIRIGLSIVSLLAALLVAAVLVAWWLFDADHAREQLAAGLGDALGMDVLIARQPAFGLHRGVSVTLSDIEVSRQGQIVATAEHARVRVALFSLLAGRIRPLELHLQRPVLSIERISPGVFNVYPSATAAGAGGDLSLRRVTASDARLSYRDHGSRQEWLFEHCELDLRDIRHDMTDRARATVAGDGEMKCERLAFEQLTISDVSVELRGGNGVLEFDVLSGTAFEGQLSAQLKVDRSSSPPGFALQGRLSQFQIGAFTGMLAPAQASTGTMDIELLLDAQGGTWQDVRDSAMGTLSMTSGELVLVGYDLDDELDGYAATQRFNLIDVGAVVLAGPFGLVASRGYAFAGLLEGSGGSTRIVQMVSQWTVEGGVAQARDVAFRTAENRLALTGGLDFGRYRFEDVRVAVVDRDGCAVVEQLITGPFQTPEVRQPNFIVTVAGPLLDLVKRGMRTITNRECAAFYTGSIPHP
jgi:uncharacterized protein involved in outer membrane biogenesis